MSNWDKLMVFITVCALAAWCAGAFALVHFILKYW